MLGTKNFMTVCTVLPKHTTTGINSWVWIGSIWIQDIAPGRLKKIGVKEFWGFVSWDEVSEARFKDSDLDVYADSYGEIPAPTTTPPEDDRWSK